MERRFVVLPAAHIEDPAVARVLLAWRKRTSSERPVPPSARAWNASIPSVRSAGDTGTPVYWPRSVTMYAPSGVSSPPSSPVLPPGLSPEPWPPSSPPVLSPRVSFPSPGSEGRLVVPGVGLGPSGPSGSSGAEDGVRRFFRIVGRRRRIRRSGPAHPAARKGWARRKGHPTASRYRSRRRDRRRGR